MTKPTSNFAQIMSAFSRPQKKAILFVGDYFLYVLAFFWALYLRLGFFSGPYFEDLFIPFFIFAGIGVGANWVMGLYNSLLRSFDFRTMVTTGLAVSLTALLITSFSYFTELPFPRSVPIIFAFIAILLLASSRILLRWVYEISIGVNSGFQNVLIYGVGKTSTEIVSLINSSRDYSLVGYLEHDKNLRGQNIAGKKIYILDEIDAIRKKHPNLKILMGISNFSMEERRAIVNDLHELDLIVQIVPELQDMIIGRSALSALRSFHIEDLLGREVIPPKKELFDNCILDKTVLITGAGGSIGSELCVQILQNKPKQVIMVDSSELAIYNLEQELEHQEFFDNPPRAYELVNVCDEQSIKRLLAQYQPEIVYHAAAYKHVPIIENNVQVGIQNNILGTFILAKACIEHNVHRCILISTDKAVRPTNVMGATKRIAELIIQAFAKQKSKTIFSMVRFGNVLGSSGSVIPLIQSQIEKGGPVTVTDREVTRYFMTIPEAAQLVIQAGFMARGGEVYFLDMGKPVLINELAELMIKLSGFSVKTDENPAGDIEIEYIGLRRGEKLFEELMLGENPSETSHPKILMANEQSISHADMMKMVSKFKDTLKEEDLKGSIDLLKTYVDGYKGLKH